jgi:3-(3-hydroxy-phenyl)propionate hydroxylase
MIHQPSLEAILRERAADEAGLDLKTGWRFISYEERDCGVVVAIDTPAGESTVRARYLVGADGARSPVRQAAAIELDDLQFDEEWLVIDTIVHDYERLPEINLQICDPARPTTCVLMGSGRHRWEFMLKPGEAAETMMNDAVIAELLRPWNVDGAVTLERKVVYRFNAKVAKTWKKGRVLLAGDAAHLTPPFAGQGLCAGIRDAANLAWKLAAVIRGAVAEHLLDDYQSEREPHARALIELAMMMGRTVCIADPEHARARDAQMLAARAAGASAPHALPAPSLGEGCLLKQTPGAGSYFPQPVAGAQRLDDVLGPGAWLISRSEAPARRQSGLIERSVDNPELSPFKASLNAWLATHDVDAVLVLPDRYVFGAGTAQSLRAAWAQRGLSI